MNSCLPGGMLTFVGIRIAYTLLLTRDPWHCIQGKCARSRLCTGICGYRVAARVFWKKLHAPLNSFSEIGLRVYNKLKQKAISGGRSIVV